MLPSTTEEDKQQFLRLQGKGRSEKEYWAYYYMIEKVEEEEKVVIQANKYFGFFAFLTNETLDAVAALDMYRNKDLIERAFGNLKEWLNFHRALVSSEQSLDRKLFIEFIALVIIILFPINVII